jgi:hypothetical protein
VDKFFDAGSEVVISEGVEGVVDEDQDDSLNRKLDTVTKIKSMKD